MAIDYGIDVVDPDEDRADIYDDSVPDGAAGPLGSSDESVAEVDLVAAAVGDGADLVELPPSVDARAWGRNGGWRPKLSPAQAAHAQQLYGGGERTVAAQARERRDRRIAAGVLAGASPRLPTVRSTSEIVGGGVGAAR